MYVCVCLGVNDKAIKAAIEAGATTVEAVTELTCAGSECGSCRPEIAAMIEAEIACGRVADRRAGERRHLAVVDSHDAPAQQAGRTPGGQQSAA